MLYAPEPNFITQDVANAFARTADVTVITAFPNYPLSGFYDGKWHFLPRKTVEGEVTVWRVPMFPDRSRSQLRRALSYISFTLSACLVAPFVGGMPRVVWVYNTPFTIGWAALWFKALFGSQLVFTYSDLWPESFLATGVSRPGRLIDILFAFRRWINEKADVIFGSTRGTVKRFEQDGVPASRLHYIPVWVQGIQEAEPEQPDTPPRIVYAGNMGTGQNLDCVVRAAGLMAKAGSPVRFDFYGYGVEEERLKALAHEVQATNLKFHGRVSSDEAFRVSSRALAQVVTLRPDPMFDMTLPSKLPFCFAAGAPVLYSLRGEAASVADQSGAGFAFDGDDPMTFVQRVEELLAMSAHQRRMLGERLRAHYRTEFSREMLLSRYQAIILGLGNSPVDGVGTSPRSESALAPKL
ncbi:MAG: glycosyltransferase family 4 protein [Gemmatimonadota bacterium]